MENAGIIAEYNPFHKGHLWQIDELRRRGAKTVTVVLGGDFTQRGRPAAFSKFTRARAALCCGADLVIELGLPWAVASAEGFARGGVATLSALGCIDTLCFGAELADADRLRQIASLIVTPAFSEVLRTQLRSSGSFPTARARAVEQFLPGSAALLAQPNNILGIEYLKACARLGANFTALPLPRQGAAHDAPAAADGYASASFLRAALVQGDDACLRTYVPPAAFELYRADLAAGAVADEDAFSRSLLTVLRTTPTELFAQLPSAGGEGLDNLLKSAAAQATDVEALYSLLKSKRYTHARVRRLALEGYLSLYTPLPQQPAYLRVLGAGEAGLALLGKAKQTATLPIVFSLAQAEKLGEDAASLAALTARAGALYGLCLQKAQPAGYEYSQKFIRL